MEEPGLHPGLEIRLSVLATRIADLREKASHAISLGRMEDFGKIEELERCCKSLDDDLCQLGSEGPDFRLGAKAEIEAGADVLAQLIEDHMR